MYFCTEKIGAPGDANALFLLRDYHQLNDSVVVRKLRDVAHALKITRKNIIFLSPVLKVPTELEKEIAVIDYQLPDKQELCSIVKKITATNASGKSNAVLINTS
ncbi:MAG: hypothetical protein LBQ57_04805 [Spirochaetales bacterium]|jgi:Tfp pilus assembly protein PilO|nr:hypothetical protein [Spirochaetales bacterium]